MKKYIILSFALLIVFSGEAQNNYLNDTELFEGMTFNDVSLAEIWETRGELSKLQHLIGDDLTETPNNTGPFVGKDLYNENIAISFEDETDTGNEFELTRISIYNSSVVVRVKNITARIGDDKSVFGDLMFNTNSESFNFIHEIGSGGLNFKIDPNSGKVVSIEYINY